MGDFSSTFRIHNRLDIDLQLKNVTLDHGYWLRRPDAGLVKAFSVSDQFQIKDNFGPNGTEGKMDFSGSRNGRNISAHIHVACPYLDPNVADISPGSPQLLVSVSGFSSAEPDYHPLIVDFIIDRQVK